MFYKYPYTNLYNLNLDWLIQAVKELQEIVEPLENVVTSVNGMTGNVELTREILTQILGGMVSKFNGRDGDVTLTAEDVNGTLIDITWTSDPGDVIGDLTQTELDLLYTSGKRILIFVNNLGVADQVYFLQYYDSHAMPQEYSPTSALAGVATFNGQTGNVTATGADLATSGADQTTIAANLANLENTKVPNTRTVNNQPLSTNVSINAENVPSQAIAGATDVEMALGNLNNSKVPNARQVNGKSLLSDITLNDEDIPSDVDGKTNVAEVLSYQSQHIDKLNAALSGPEAIPENANLNNYIETKAWRLENLNVINGPDTALVGNYGTLYVRRNSGYISQFFIDNNGKIATRFCLYTTDSQTWSEWNIYSVNTDVDKLKWKLVAKDSPNINTYIPDANWTELFILVRVGNSAQGFSFYYHKTNNNIKLHSGFPYTDGYCNCSITIQETSNAVIKETLIWYNTDRLADGLVTIYYK